MDGEKHKSNAYTQRYNKAHYESLRIRVPIGLKKAIEAHADKQGKSINELVNGLIRADMGLTEDEWTASDKGQDKGEE